mmetsp:Transcript_8330/g.17351  ORF Transcript_8330/g.17351 Transcript_8330/m.17351 type:complete len:331 (-) Transcript_8330:244-1236(-)
MVLTSVVFFVAAQNINKLFRVEKDFDILELQFVIDHGRSKSKHFHQLSLTLVAFKFARKGSPVTPSESHLGGSRKDFQHFPRKGGKCLVEGIVRIFPSDFVVVPHVGGDRIEQDVVVTHFVGFNVVIGLSSIGSDLELFRVDRLMLVGVCLVRPFHFPRLDEILHNEFQRSFGMNLGSLLEKEKIGHGIIGFPPKSPLNVGIVHKTSFGFLESKFFFNLVELLSRFFQLFLGHGLSGSIDGQGSLIVRLRQRRSFGGRTHVQRRRRRGVGRRNDKSLSGRVPGSCQEQRQSLTMNAGHDGDNDGLVGDGRQTENFSIARFVMSVADLWFN